MLERFDEPEVASLALLPPVGVVEEQARGANGVDGQGGDNVVGSGEVEPVVVQVGAGTGLTVVLVDTHADDPEEFHDGVIEGEVVAYDFVGAGAVGGGHVLVSGLHEALVLGDDALEGSLGELGSLVLVEVDVGDKDLGSHRGVGQRGEVGDGLQGGGVVVAWVKEGALLNLGQGIAVTGEDVALCAAGKLEEIEEFAEADLYLGAVELQGDEGQGKAGVQGEPKVKGHVEDAWLARKHLQRQGGVVFAGHFLQAFSGCAREFLPDVAHLAGDFVDALSSNEEGCALDHGLSDGVCPVGLNALSLGVDIIGPDDGVTGGVGEANTRQVDPHVHPVNEIADAVKVAAGVGIKLSLTLIKVKIVCFESKVGVSLDDMAPEGNHGFSGENPVGQTKGDKLINGTTKGGHCFVMSFIYSTRKKI